MTKFLSLSTYDDAHCMLAGSLFGPMQFNLKIFMAAKEFDVPWQAGLAGLKFSARVEGFANY